MKCRWWRSAFLSIAVVGTACSTPTGGESSESSAPVGVELAVEKNCVSCHTASGIRSVGPTWQFLAGSEVTLETGEVVRADAEYLRRSMLDPQSQIVAGFTTVRMPTIELRASEVEALVDYIESLGRRSALG